MSNQLITKRAITLLSLASLLLVGVFAAQGNQKPAKPARPDCSATTDADLIKAVQEKIKADPQFKDQLKQINVSSKGNVVTLDGWVKGPAAKNAAGKHAKSVPCVKKVVNNLGTRLKVGCGPGQKQCGDICIDRDSDCNIMR